MNAATWLSTLIRNYDDVFLAAASGRVGEAFATNLGQEGLKAAPCERLPKRMCTISPDFPSQQTQD